MSFSAGLLAIWTRVNRLIWTRTRGHLRRGVGRELFGELFGERAGQANGGEPRVDLRRVRKDGGVDNGQARSAVNVTAGTDDGQRVVGPTVCARTGGVDIVGQVGLGPAEKPGRRRPGERVDRDATIVGGNEMGLDRKSVV